MVVWLQRATLAGELVCVAVTEKKKKKKHLDTFLPKEIPNRVQTKSMAQSVTAAASIY